MAYQETVWAMGNAFEFRQACQSLDKRESNNNCSSLCWGPGSVGLSRYTAPVEAMYGGKNHCMFASKTILGAGNKSPRCRLV